MNFFRIFYILRRSNIFPQEIWDSIFSKIIRSNKGYCIMKDYSITEFNWKCRDAIYIQFPNNKRLKNNLIDNRDKIFISVNSYFPEVIEAIIPDGVEYVDDYVFTNCLKLKNIHLGSSIIELGKSVFEGCINIGKIELPNSIAEMGSNCFKDCKILEEIVLSNNLQTIPIRCFSQCLNLRYVVLPEKIKYIQRYAFNDCCSLQNVTFPKSIKRIENR